MWNQHAFHLGIFIYIELLILSIRKTDVIENTPTYGQKDLDANFLCVLFFFFFILWLHCHFLELGFIAGYRK